MAHSIGGRPAAANAEPVEVASDLALDIAGIVAQLRSSRERWRDSQGRSREIGGRELPSLEALAAIVECLRGALFPMRLGPPNLRQETEDYYVGHTLDKALSALLVQVRLELRYRAKHEGQSRGAADSGSGSMNVAASPPPSGAVADDARALEIVRAFGAALPGIRDLLDTDVTAAFEGDPAARSVDEVLLCYPGVHAMIHHRIAHALYRLGLPLLARLVAEIAHGDTGIDIHPGASIGPAFFIDHGTGIVIGETALIGRNVRLYQQVTLGAKRFAVDDDGKLRKGGARHPIVEDDVVVYAGATILGRVTIGRGSSIGGNVWLTRSVPPNSHITQARSQEDPRDDAVVSPDASR
jgi:serine O-acetyltransferase